MKIVDLSAWQEDVDWDALSKEFDGVILKIGQGTNMDSMFVEHVNNAVAHNMPYGVYYYNKAQSIEEAQAEAQQVDEWIKTWLNGKNPQLGIWADVEDERMLRGDATESAMTFVNYLWGIGYNYVGIYTSYNWLTYGNLNTNALKGVALWVAQYYHENSILKEQPDLICKIWQYTDHYSDEFPYDASIYYE